MVMKLRMPLSVEFLDNLSSYTLFKEVSTMELVVCFRQK